MSINYDRVRQLKEHMESRVIPDLYVNGSYSDPDDVAANLLGIEVGSSKAIWLFGPSSSNYTSDKTEAISRLQALLDTEK